MAVGVFSSLCLLFECSLAQSVADYCVRLSATVYTNPPEIRLSWTADTQAISYTVYRKEVDSTDWGSSLDLPASSTNYSDVSVVTGHAYEYRVTKLAATYGGDGYVCAGIEVPLSEFRGKLILIVDSTQATSLATELDRLQQDLVGDGWTVLRRNVSRMSVSPADTGGTAWTARSNEVYNVKSIVMNEYIADPSKVKGIFLFGRVPVPYSGLIYPDDHTDHRGAWPADVYYGEIDGDWTDTVADSTAATDPRNDNVPGDSKFDFNRPPSSVELQVGRVDLANLPAFSLNETELLRRYLGKNHSYRHKIITIDRRALIDDHLNILSGQAIAVSGWRNFAPCVGASNTFTGDWLTTLSSQSYLWGYGCGGGTYTSCSGVASTAQLATNDPHVIFTALFGSYFGDWDTTDNLLRASISTPTYTLTSVWSARPHWLFHHMALGETIGFSARLTQNNVNLYFPNRNPREVHIALMGDPTLRMHPVGPASSLTIARNSTHGVDLCWTSSTDTVAGYHVYRAATSAGPFTRLNSSLIVGTNYTDPVVTSDTYMVRAVKLEVSASGSYWNASQGIFGALPPNRPPVAPDRQAATPQGHALHLAIEKLLAGASDPDGDTLSISGVSATSTNGGIVSLTASDIVFEPDAGFFGNDRFSYTVADGRGGVTVVQVDVNVVPEDQISPNIIMAPVILPNGHFYVGFAGIPFFSYTIQYSAHIEGPWTTLTNISAGTNGLFDFEDPSENVPARFYRCAEP